MRVGGRRSPLPAALSFRKIGALEGVFSGEAFVRGRAITGHVARTGDGKIAVDVKND